MGLMRRSTEPQPPPVVNVAVPPSYVDDVLRRPTIRVGLYAWALLGAVGILVVLGQIVGALSVVVVPLVLALFPAAVLAPVVGWLEARNIPSALAAGGVILGVIGVFIALGFIVAPQVAEQMEGLSQQVRLGAAAVESFLASGPLGLDPIRMEDLVERAQEQITSGGAGVGQGVLGAVGAVTQGIAGTILGFVALFLYLKDGPRLAAWLRSLFPETVRDDAAEVGVLAWQTVGAYVRGQVFIALVDAILIGVGIAILGVPLALPLTVLVFLGGLFPIVGAVLAGVVAALVALATEGLTTAIIVVIIIVVVQQIEGNVLAPVVMGRATEMHALATLAALTAGAVLLGVLGAFLAIPVTASVARTVGYLRRRRRERLQAAPT